VVRNVFRKSVKRPDADINVERRWQGILAPAVPVSARRPRRIIKSHDREANETVGSAGAQVIDGPGLGQRLRLGLESLPRLATSGRPVWSGGLGTMGPPAAVGAAAATSTAVGTRGQPDVKPDRQWVGILEQRRWTPI
jgi:hypothetical protein